MPNFSAQCVKGVQGIGYVCSFLLSLCICVPMSMHQDQFKGHCLLFSTGVWQEKDGQLLVSWANQAYCNFTIFVAVIQFVISLFQFVRFLKFFYKGRDSTFLSAFVDVIVCAFMTIMTLTAALFVTLGFKVWCEEITKRFENCSDAVGSNTIDKEENIDTNDFFNQMFTAQFGIWISFTVWFTLLTFSVVKLCRYHHEENLRVSMAKERKRLINEDLVSEVPPGLDPRDHGSRGDGHHHYHHRVAGMMSSGGDGAIQRHRRRFNVRGRTAAAAAQQAAAAQAAAEINSAQAAASAAEAVAASARVGTDLNVSTEDVVVHGDDVAQGHRGPFSNDEDVAPSSAAAVRRDQDALYDVQVQKQIQRRLEDGDRSIDRSSNNSRLSSHQGSCHQAVTPAAPSHHHPPSSSSTAGTAAGGPPSGQNGSFGYQGRQSDHELDDRYSNSSFGSSSHASTDKQPSSASASQSAAGAVQGNQLSVEVDDTNPWK